jgi:hypothetical protein
MTEMCGTCGATFGSPADLMAHLSSAHQNDAPGADLAMNPEARTPGFVCGMCGRRFPTPETLASHSLRPHSTSPRAVARRNPAVA